MPTLRKLSPNRVSQSWSLSVLKNIQPHMSFVCKFLFLVNCVFVITRLPERTSTCSPLDCWIFCSMVMNTDRTSPSLYTQLKWICISIMFCNDSNEIRWLNASRLGVDFLVWTPNTDVRLDYTLQHHPRHLWTNQTMPVPLWPNRNMLSVGAFEPRPAFALTS